MPTLEDNDSKIDNSYAEGRGGYGEHPENDGSFGGEEASRLQDMEQNFNDNASSSQENSNIAIIDGLDLLAALIILSVDYHVENSSSEVSLEDAGDVVVAQLDAGRVSVDFDKTCDTERAVQAKLAGRGTGMADVNLLEVEIEMLVAKRNKLADDEVPDAGFRVYGEGAQEGTTDGSSPLEAV